MKQEKEKPLPVAKAHRSATPALKKKRRGLEAGNKTRVHKKAPALFYVSHSQLSQELCEVVFSTVSKRVRRTTSQLPLVKNQTAKQVRLLLIGTAHISKPSVDLVEQQLRKINPQLVFLELDEERRAVLLGNRWEQLDLVKILRSGKTFFFLAQLFLALAQKKLARKTGSPPGGEFKRALQVSQTLSLPVELVDRPIALTLKRFWRTVSLWSKLKFLVSFFGVAPRGKSAPFTEEIDAKTVEELKDGALLTKLVEELSSSFPVAKAILIDERDVYMGEKMRALLEEAVLSEEESFDSGALDGAKGKREIKTAFKAVAVVGAGHLAGLLKFFQGQHSLALQFPLRREACYRFYEAIPPRTWAAKMFPWVMTTAFLALFVTGFFLVELSVFSEALVLWIFVNGSLAALGCLFALGHPLTIVVGFLAAPLTSLNFFIGAGMVTGLVQLLLAPPKVSDFKTVEACLPQFSTWWKNRITKIFLVFLFSSIGSALGTWIAVPYLAQLFF